jgi:hypothetical protein
MYVCWNGREWLSRQMDAAGMRYVRRDNCFAEIDDLERAQQLMQEQLRVNWGSLMNRLTRQVHPLHSELFRDPPHPYYWSVSEGEWASDIMFRSVSALQELDPRLIRHGIDLKHRPEGVRLKQRAGKNSVKMYDKQGDGAAGGDDAQRRGSTEGVPHGREASLPDGPGKARQTVATATASLAGSPAAGSKEAKPTGRPMSSASPHSTNRSTSTTCTPRCSIFWASTTRGSPTATPAATSA